MKKSDEKALLTIDESMFLQLLAGSGTVHVRINRFGQYFVPFVYFTKCDTDEPEPRGVIVRNKDMLGAETMEDLLDVLADISGGMSAMNIERLASAVN